MASPDEPQATVDVIARQLAGIVSRAQLLATGMTAGQLRALLVARRWRRLTPGTYATYTGPLPPLARVWVAVLAAGRGAVITGRTALWLWGVVDDPGRLVDLCIPHGRSVRALEGVRVRRARDLRSGFIRLRLRPGCRWSTAARRARPTHSTGRCDRPAPAGDPAANHDAGSHRCRAGLPRWTAALDCRARHRWRRLVAEVLGVVAQSAQSALEHRYLVGVERAHGLPHAQRNRAEMSVGVSTTYRDVRYPRWRLVIELDGQQAHPAYAAHRDRLRDNELTLKGNRTLRYGWYEVIGLRCIVAGQVATALTAQGWRGTPRRCGPTCTINLSDDSTG